MPEFRTIDGTNNNLDHPELNNATGASLQRLTEQDPERINDPLSTREISNVVVGQGDAEVANRQGLSELFTTWGQFVDHTLDRLSSNQAQPLNIPIPLDDQTFPPGGELPVNRSLLNPDGEARNNLTGWLDASMVYGSDAAKLASLRGPDGTMLLGPSGDELPAVGAGDVRARENDYLTSLHVLFLKEHNRLVGEFKAEDPSLTSDQLFDKARAWVDAEIANITLNDWLPHVLGHKLEKYDGYDSSIDARESVEFVTAAFRFGHSMVGDDIEKHDEAGNLLQAKDLSTDFIDGSAGFADLGGSAALLRAQAAETAFALDARINDDLRNFLVDGGPVSDLAAINLQRGRDLGVGTLNDVREDLGLKPFNNFNQLTKDKATADALQEVYGDIDDVELWIGGLAEKTKGDALVGPTFASILEQQFEALRDGDRLYFENVFSRKDVADIKATTLGDIIERNSDTIMQEDVFLAAERRSSDAKPENPEASQLIIATDGFARLMGGSNDDTLFAGSGRDIMTGGKGADVFDLSSDAGTRAVITDFQSGIDKIKVEDLEQVDRFRELDIDHNRNGDVVINAGNDRIVLQGVSEIRPLDVMFSAQAGGQQALASSETVQLTQAMAGFIPSAAPVISSPFPAGEPRPAAADLMLPLSTADTQAQQG